MPVAASAALHFDEHAFDEPGIDLATLDAAEDALEIAPENPSRGTLTGA